VSPRSQGSTLYGGPRRSGTALAGASRQLTAKIDFYRSNLELAQVPRAVDPPYVMRSALEGFSGEPAAALR
jgi:hypothetical protein